MGIDHRRHGQLPSCWFLTDSARVNDAGAAIIALPGGCGVILRDYQRLDRRDWAKNLIALCRRHRRPVLYAGDIRQALALGADGVHLPEGMARRHRRPRPGFIISEAAHGRRSLIRARRDRADVVLLSRLFLSLSHQGAPALGPIRFRLAALGVRMAIYPLGGVDAQSIRQLAGIRIAGYAAIGGFGEGKGSGPATV